MQVQLERAHGSIVEVLETLHTYFAADSDEVLREWARFVTKVGTAACMSVPKAGLGTRAHATPLLGDSTLSVGPRKAPY